MNSRALFAISLFLFNTICFGQTKIEFLFLNEAQKPIPFVAVQYSNNSKVFYSDSTGRLNYFLESESENISINASHFNFEYFTKVINLKSDTVFYIIQLKEKTFEALEVEVISDKNTLWQINPSQNQLSIRTLKLMPTNFGEADIIKQISFQAGVSHVGDGSSAYFVRGSQSNNNLILLDGAPVYDPTHVLGLFSAFNSDIIQKATFYKTYIPPSLAGRTASFLEIDSKNGDSTRWNGIASIGLITSKLNLNGPIFKNKLMVNFGIRGSYIDKLLNIGNAITNEIPKNDGLYFYDINFKLNYNLSRKHAFFYSFFNGQDVLKQKPILNLSWGNQNHVFDWKWKISRKINVSTQLINSSFAFKLLNENDNQSFGWSNSVNTYSLKSTAQYQIDEKKIISLGLSINHHQIKPATFEPIASNSFFRKIEINPFTQLESRFFIEFQTNISKKISFKGGFNLVNYALLGPYSDVKYINPDNPDFPVVDTVINHNPNSIVQAKNIVEPRLFLSYTPTQNIQIYSSYLRTSQGIHQIITGISPLPISYWVANSRYIPISISNQFSLGSQYKNPFWGELTFELFYKKQSNTPDFTDNASIFLNKDFVTSIRWGQTTSYGLELSYNTKIGIFQPYFSYTLSKSEMITPDVNQNKPYPSFFDRRHVFAIIGILQISKKLTASFTFNYASGRPVTLPSGVYQYQYYQLGIISERNGYRFPDYHRLDLALNYFPISKSKLISAWNFTIYNAYNQKNPFLIAMKPVFDDTKYDKPLLSYKPEMVYLFSIIPSFSYSLRF